MRRLCFLLFALLSSCNNNDKTVALVLPVEHLSLAEIKDGFVLTLGRLQPDYKVICHNGLGDPTMLQTIMQTLCRQKTAYIVPIGETCTRLTQKLCPDQIILGLASSADLSNKNTSIVEDEVGPETLMRSLTEIFPDVHKVTIIHGQDDKIIREISELMKLSKKHKKTLQLLPIIQTNDLKTVCPAIKGDVVLILKDHAVVSGIEVLVQYTKRKGILLIASDEGSVKQGADYAFGVTEREIGVKGAELLSQIIEKKVSMPCVRKISPRYIVSPKISASLSEKIERSMKNQNLKTV